MTDLDCRARMVAPLTHMAFAPNGRFLACFTTSGVLTVVSTDFDVMVLDFDASHSRETSSSSSQPPLDMQWCGEDRYGTFVLSLIVGIRIYIFYTD
jgi:hypothetical protein